MSYTLETKYKALQRAATNVFHSRKGVPWVSVPFALTFEDYVALSSLRCYYCGNGLPEFGHGLDRIVPAFGYVPGNCRPCCKDCNEIKGDREESDLYRHIVKMVIHRLDKALPFMIHYILRWRSDGRA